MSQFIKKNEAENLKLFNKIKFLGGNDVSRKMVIVIFFTNEARPLLQSIQTCRIGNKFCLESANHNSYLLNMLQNALNLF